MGWGLAATLHVLVAAQGGLPAILLTAMLTFELSARVVRTVSVSLPVSFHVWFGVEAVVAVNAARVAGEPAVTVVERVRLFGQYYVVRVIVLRVRLCIVLLDG